MSKRLLDAWVGAVIGLAAFGLYFWGIPAWVEPSDFAQIPPDLFPRVAVGAIMVLSALMVVSRLLIGDDTRSAINPHSLVLGAGLLVMFAAGVALMLWVGYIAGGAILVAALMVFMGVRRWTWLLGLAGLAPVLLFAFFDRLLGIPMP